MVQRRAARYVHNRYHNTSSVTDMMNQLNWRSLQHRRRDTRLCMIYKVYHGLIAVPADDLVLKQRVAKNSHCMAFHIPHSNTNYRKFSFFPRSIVEWNYLPSLVVLSPSIDVFRSRVATIEYNSIPHMPAI